MYRLFERQRFDPAGLRAVVRRTLLEQLPPKAPLVAVIDDTMLRRCGRKVAEAHWCRDSQGPHFTHQIAWGQTVIELCAILPQDPAKAGGSARAVPLRIELQRAAPKPSRKAGEQAMQQWREQRRLRAMPRLGAEMVEQLRTELDESGEHDRQLIVAFDGGYTNKSLFAKIPERTVLVGRMRKDAKLYAPPLTQPRGAGRRRLYGERLPTPQEVLKDPATKWKKIRLFAFGKMRTFHYAIIDRCRWKSAPGRDLRVIVIRPLSRRPHERGRRLHFAHPGYLVCSDPRAAIRPVLQAYIHRWEIEVCFREQKTNLGMGQAQTRTQPATSAVLQYQAFAHAMLLLATHRAQPTPPPLPKWRQQQDTPTRTTMNQMQSILRDDLWYESLQAAGNSARKIKTTSPPPTPPKTNPPKFRNTAQNAAIYAFQ